MADLIRTWSNNADAEDSMTDEHAWIWRYMIDCIPGESLKDASILDIGCNQGGFLRMLYDTRPFASGVGVDIAKDRVDLANAAKGTRPVRYVATPEITEVTGPFDLAFSHEVIYLIEDLAEHARQVSAVLKPGGHYDAVTCCHADNPLYVKWKPMIEQISNIPVPNHSVADIVDAFRSEGLQVSVSRFLAAAFIPTGQPSAFMPTELDRIETYTQWKLCFRCTKPD